MASARAREASLDAAPKSADAPNGPNVPQAPRRHVPRPGAVELPVRRDAAPAGDKHIVDVPPAREEPRSRDFFELPEPSDVRSADRPRPPVDSQPADTGPVDTEPVAAPVHRPRAPLVVGALIVVLLAVVAVSYATNHTDRSNQAASRPGATTAVPQGNGGASRSSSTPSAAPSVSLALRNQRAAIAWIGANLPRTTRLLAAASTVSQLSAAGFANAGPTITAPQYVVQDAAGRASAAEQAPLSRSVPVARFGSGIGAVQVRSVLTLASDRVASVLAADRVNRKLAGTALATNPQLSTSEAVRTVLRAGDLDLRAATLLALVAADIHVRVIAVPLAGAEAAASRPHRVLVIAASGSAAASVRAAATALPRDYAPAHIAGGAAGSIVLTWSPSAQPVAAVT